MAKSIKTTWNEIKNYYVKIYMDVYYPVPKNILLVTEDKNLISYSQAIELMKQSAYGIQTKYKAVKNAVLKETGRKVVEKTYTFKHFLLNKGESLKEYIPSSGEELEFAKEMMLYDQILQEFTSSNSFGYYDSDNQLKCDVFYNKTFIKIDNSRLEEFLRIKELELQPKLLTSNHEHIA